METQASIEPRIFENTDLWIRRINRDWQFREPADLHCQVTPDVVQAASGHTLTVTFCLGPDLTLSPGAHVTMEVPATWEAHLGNCFRRKVRTVASRDQIKSGYGAFVDVTCSSPGVRLGLAASWGRMLDLVDVVVQEGEVGPGDKIQLVLGPPDGNLIQAQKYAQVAIWTVGVDREGDGSYQRAAAHPTIRVLGAYADHLRIFAPATVQPGEPFALRLLPVDLYSRNPATGYEGTVLLTAGKGLDVPEQLVVDSTASPTGVSAEGMASRPGVHAVVALDPARGISGRSNPIWAGLYPDRQVYFGELHSQMWHSMGTGTTAEFFEWGRDTAGLDFCAPANHYNWRFELTDEIWREMVQTCNKFYEPGRFATLVSYEWGGSRGSGHKNVYYRGDDGTFDYWYREPKSPDEFWASLSGQDVLTIPHHSKAFGGMDWSYRSDRHQRLVEICSKWGIAESGGASSVQAALAMGHRLGFVGGTDSHYGLANQGSYHVNDGNGLTAVAVPALTRDALWQALYDRRCYATTGDRIVLDVSLDGSPMGADLAADLSGVPPRILDVRVAGTWAIDTVEVVRNGEVVYEVHPGADVWQGTWTDDEPLDGIALAPTFAYDRPFVYYYVRVTQGNRQQAWSSPIWLTQMG